MTRPTPPIELAIDVATRPAGPGTHLSTVPVEVSDRVLHALAATCPTDTTASERAEASRDWWPLTMHWALAGEVPQMAGAVCSPRSTDEVAALLRVCHDERIPVTAAGGRSGVCGASVPVFGGVVLDLTSLTGVVAVDDVSGVVEVLAGTFGPDLERELTESHGLSVGHFPQSFDLATVGGWVACRGAGQYSTRYGKIEDMVVGLEVVLADGTIVRTGGAPAAAVGPDLTQVFVGSEGTLGIVTRVWLRTHPVAPVERTASYAFATFEEGLEACRTIIRRGATPAVLRLYDAAESQRGQNGDGTQCIMLVLDEGDPSIVDATMQMVAEQCGDAVDLGHERIEAWKRHRNDTSALQALTRKGFVVDTLEIAAPWSALPIVFDRVRAALLGVPHARAATCHLSHSYSDGACLYFTFAATPPTDQIESTYVALWDAGQRAVLANGGNLSHHHGVGLNRGRFVREAFGSSFDRAGRPEAGARPDRHPEPGQARPRLAVRRRRVAMRPTSGPTTGPVSVHLDWSAIRAGAMVCLVFAVPFSLTARWAADNRQHRARRRAEPGGGCRLRRRLRRGLVGPAGRVPVGARTRHCIGHLPGRPGGLHRHQAADRPRGAVVCRAVQRDSRAVRGRDRRHARRDAATQGLRAVHATQGQQHRQQQQQRQPS